MFKVNDYIAGNDVISNGYTFYFPIDIDKINLLLEAFKQSKLYDTRAYKNVYKFTKKILTNFRKDKYGFLINHNIFLGYSFNELIAQVDYILVVLCDKNNINLPLLTDDVFLEITKANISLINNDMTFYHIALKNNFKKSIDFMNTLDMYSSDKIAMNGYFYSVKYHKRYLSKGECVGYIKKYLPKEVTTILLDPYHFKYDFMSSGYVTNGMIYLEIEHRRHISGLYIAINKRTKTYNISHHAFNTIEELQEYITN